MARADRARLLLEHELVQEAIQKVRDHCRDEFVAAAVDDDERLRRAKLLLNAAERFFGHFAAIVNDGLLAASEKADTDRRKAGFTSP
jgi:hypothetical protein